MSDKEEDLDDIFDEDLDDLEDLDDIEDLEDLDDDMVEDSKAAGDQAAPQKPVKKSFLQKFFLPLVLLASFVIVVGGYLVLVSGGGAPPSGEAPAQSDMAPENFAAQSEPEQQPQDTDNAEEGQIVGTQQAQEQAGLTPLPAGDAQDSLPKLPNFSNNQSSGQDSDQSAMPDIMALKQESRAEQEPGIQENTDQSVSESFDEPSVMPAPAKTHNKEQGQSVDSSDMKEIMENLGAMRDEMRNLSNKVSSVESRLSRIESDMRSAVKTHETLESQTKAVSDELKQVQETVKSMRAKVDRAVQQSSAQQQETRPTIRQQTRQSAPSPSRQPVRQMAASIKDLEIKSATSGLVHISNTKTGDTKILSVGDHHDILGKIQSIEFIDGKWVVKGSKTSISR